MWQATANKKLLNFFILLSSNFLIAGISFLIRPDAKYDCPSIEYIFDSVKNNFPAEFEGKTIAHGINKKRQDATHQCPYTWATQGNAKLH